MRLSIALIAAAAIGLGAVAAGSSSAAASTALPLTPLVHQGAQSAEFGTHEVRYRRGARRHGWSRGHRYAPRRHAYRHYGPRRYGYRHHRRDRGAAAAAGIFGFALGAMAGQAFSGPGYYGGQHNAHVQWCANRYRSYDVRTDSFLSYDGSRYRCNSPYIR